jgi:predicted AlkP superfamily pyrophosphatase or phosphodiesterase
MKEEKVIIIFIDAFSSRYLDKDYTPVLYGLYQKGYCKKIEPLPAFEGIGATAFSGTWPITNGVWTNFVRKENPCTTTFYASLHSLFKISDLIPNDRLAWDFRYILYKIFKKPVPIPNLIPPNLLCFFESKLDSPIFKDKALGEFPTLFDVVKKAEKTITIIDQSIFGSDEKIAANTIRYLRQGNLSHLTYLKFSSLDNVGHRFGPLSQKTIERLKVIDSLISKIIDEVSRYNNVTILIFSDHGMVPVSCYVNLLKLLRKIPLMIRKDYLFFLDSTMARFWFSSQSAYNIIESVLSDLKYGFLLSDEDLRRANLPVNKEEYGMLIFALKERTVINPDFFHKNTLVKGMHSYFNSKYDNPIFAFFPINYNIKKNTLRFIDIMPTALKLLDVPIPETCEGEPVIR